MLTFSSTATNLTPLVFLDNWILQNEVLLWEGGASSAYFIGCTGSGLKGWWLCIWFPRGQWKEGNSLKTRQHELEGQGVES